eukprot:4460001-Amphidinium_carterae.1
MAQEMIMTIQTSADGVRTEQQSMERVFQSRSVMLSEHLANVSQHVVRNAQSGGTSSFWTRNGRLHLETAEVQVLRASLECAEHHLRDLAKFTEYEHGAAQQVLREDREFNSYRYVENQARGNSDDAQDED